MLLGRVPTDDTFLLELGIICEDVQGEGVVPSVNEFDSFVEIVDSDYG